MKLHLFFLYWCYYDYILVTHLSMLLYYGGYQRVLLFTFFCIELVYFLFILIYTLRITGFFYFSIFISYFNRYIMFTQPLTVFYFEFPAIFWRTFSVTWKFTWVGLFYLLFSGFCPVFLGDFVLPE